MFFAFKTFLALVAASVFAFGAGSSAVYDVEYGWFKELGDAKADLKMDGNNYHIKIQAKTKGLAKFLSRNREELYESYGVLTPKGYLPSKFVQVREWSNRIDKTTYLFNHKAKSVQKIREKYEDKKLIDKTEEVNDYYADNDILTLYFNISDDFKGMKEGSQKVYYAVGANPKDGRVDLIIPSGKKLDEIRDTFEGVRASSYVIVYINQKIFSSERGELWLAFNSKNECERATLKDVILFGDIRGILRR